MGSLRAQLDLPDPERSRGDDFADEDTVMGCTPPQVTLLPSTPPCTCQACMRTAHAWQLCQPVSGVDQGVHGLGS